MSMINDALKRAQDSQPKSRAAEGPPLRPVMAARRPGGTDIVMPSLIVVILLLAGVLIFAWYRSKGEVQVRARSTDMPASANATVLPSPSKIPATTATATAVNVTNAPPTASAIEVPVAKPAVAPEPPRPAPVVFKLQAIVYQPKHASAIINGKTVFVGDRVAEARVVAIGNDSVTIVTAAGATNELELP